MGTCSICGHRDRRFVPSVSGELERERSRKRTASNNRYHHECGGWKSKKVRYQWARHGAKIIFVPKNFPVFFQEEEDDGQEEIEEET